MTPFSCVAHSAAVGLFVYMRIFLAALNIGHAVAAETNVFTSSILVISLNDVLPSKL